MTPWTSQPQCPIKVDRSTRANSAITTLIPFNGANIDLVTNAPVVFSTSGSIAVSTNGRSLRSTGASASASIDINLSAFGLISVSFWLYWDAYSTSDNLAMEYGNPNFVTSHGFIIDPSSGAPFSGSFQVGANGVGRSFTRPSAAAWHHYAVILTSGSTADCLAAWVDGVPQSLSSTAGSSAGGSLFGKSTLQFFSRASDSLFGTGNLQNVVIRGGYIITQPEVTREYQNPWSIFAPLRRPWERLTPPASVTVYYPGSDISAGGWISSTGGTLASCLDETPYDDADYITSPDLTTSATLAWQSSIPAGTWDIAVRGEYLGTSGQIRVVLLDAGGSTVGTSSWQALTGSFATYTLTVTTSGTSTKFRYEVQP